MPDLRDRDCRREFVTKPRPDAQLVGLVYGATDIPHEARHAAYQRPVFWAAIVAVVFVILNIIFW